MENASRGWSTAPQRSARAISAWGPVVVTMAVIFVLSARPDEHGGLDLGNVVPKLAHVAEYALLGFLAARAIGIVDRPWLDRRVLLVIVLIALYAVSDEIHQSFVPSREARLSDVAIDIAGGLLGVAAWRVFARRARRI